MLACFARNIGPTNITREVREQTITEVNTEIIKMSIKLSSLNIHNRSSDWKAAYILFIYLFIWSID